MSDYQTLLNEIERIELREQPQPPAARDTGAHPTKKEQPHVFYRVFFGTLILLLLAIALPVAVFCVFTPARLAPDYRLATSHRDDRITSVAVANEHVVTGSESGMGNFQPHSLWWDANITKDSTQQRLPTNHVPDLSIEGEKAAVIFRDEGAKDDNACRGLVIGKQLESSPSFWSQPALDLSTFKGGRPTAIEQATQGDLLFGGFGGIQPYDSDKHHWKDPINAANHGLSDDHVCDLRRTSSGILVANANLDVCSDANGDWQLKQTISGLSSKGIVTLYPIASTTAGNLDVWFITGGQGLGEVSLLPDGREASRKKLVSERSVPGLTEEACRDATYNEKTQLLWTTFVQNGGLGIARYAERLHDLLGTQEPLSLTSQPICIGSHSASVLVGTDDGLWEAREQSDKLVTGFRGPKAERITEIADSEKGPLTHAEQKKTPTPDEATTRISYALQTVTPTDGQWAWADLIGPRRFPALHKASSILCAARVPDSDTFLFGTDGLGIGQYSEATHELSLRFPPRASQQEVGLPDPVITDIACPAEDDVLAVTQHNSLAHFDGHAWGFLLNTNGLPGKSQDVVTAASHGTDFALAGDNLVGRYDIKTHNWQPLPELHGIGRLQFAGDGLWALDKEQTLYNCDTANNTWKLAAPKVRALSADGDLLRFISGGDQEVRQLEQARNGDQPRSLINPVPLPRNARDIAWTTASCIRNSLFAGGKGETCEYDLDEHKWSALGWPSGAQAPVAQVAATPSGLWLRDSIGSLFFRSNAGGWKNGAVARGVESLSPAGESVLALCGSDSENNSPRLLSLADSGSPAVLIGAAYQGDTKRVTAAGALDGSLFIGGDRTVSCYGEIDHGWANETLPEQETLASLSSTNHSMYVLTNIKGEKDGHLYCFTSKKNEFNAIQDPKTSKDMLVSMVSTDGQYATARVAAGDILRAVDTQPTKFATIYTSSGSDFRNRTVICAAEYKDELALGCSDGAILDYRLCDDGRLRWNATTTGVSTAVNKVEIVSNSARFVVDDASVALQTREAGRGDWKTTASYPSAQASGCDAWRVDGKEGVVFGARTSDSDRSLGCLSLVQFVSSDPKNPPDLMVRGGLPATDKTTRTVSVAELVDANHSLLVKVDSTGMVGSYDVTSHTWQKESIDHVSRLMGSMNQLWALSAKKGILFRRDNDKWTQINVADAAANAAHMLVRLSNGSVSMLDATGKPVPPSLAGPIPDVLKDRGGDIRAYVDMDETLLVATSDQIVGYSLTDHSWKRLYSGAVSQLVKVGDSAYAVPLSGGKAIVRWTKGNDQFSEMASLPSAPARIVMLGGTLCVSTRGCGLYAAAESAQREWKPLVDEEKGRLEGPQWPTITCACEFQGMLVLGLDDGKVTTWDSDKMAWHSSSLGGLHPDRLVVFGKNLVIAASDTTGSKALLTYDPSADKFNICAKDLRDIHVHTRKNNDVEVWCISGGGQVRQLTEDLAISDIKGAFGAPPAKGTLTSLRAVGKDLVATWSDGSIWHHASDATGWRQCAEPVSDSSGTFHRQIGELSGLLVSSNPDGSLLIWNADDDRYGPLSGKPVKPVAAKASWVVVSPTEVRRADSDARISIVDGRLSCDDIRQIAVDDSFVYCVTADGGIEQLDRRELDPNRTVPAPHAEVVQRDQIDNVKRLLRPVDTLQFEGARYACAQTASGQWKGMNDRKLSITQRSGAGAWPLTPASAGNQYGVALQWVFGCRFDNRELTADIPDGQVKAAIDRDLNLAIITVTSGAAKQPPAPAVLNKSDLIANSTFGAHWAMSKANSLELILGRQHVPVSLDDTGFGFDHVAAMTVTDKNANLYTRDGKVTYAFRDGVPSMDSIDSRMAVSADCFTATWFAVDELTSPKVLLISTDADRAMEFRDGWKPISTNDAWAAVRTVHPLLLDGKLCQWTSDDAVTLLGAQSKVKTRFLPSYGRLAIDVVFAIGSNDGKMWALTASGLCTLGDGGQTNVVYDDPAFDWTKGGKFIAERNNGQTTFYVRLTTKDGQTSVLKWDGQAWRQVSKEEGNRVLDGQRTNLLKGATWQVNASDINDSGKRKLARHWPWNRNDGFTQVRLIDDGKDTRFDYERINGIGAYDNLLWVATEAGVMQVDLAMGDLVGCTKPGNADSVRSISVVMDEKNGKRLVAQTADGKYGWSDSRKDWSADAAVSASSFLVNTKLWSVRMAENGGGLQFKHLFAGGSKLIEVELKPVSSDPALSRFDFDSANAVASNGESLALLTPRGLIMRTGAKQEEARLGQLDNVKALFAFGPREKQVIIGDCAAELYKYDIDGAWVRLESDQAEMVQSGRGRIQAWNEHWQITSQSGELKFALKLQQDTDYQPATYSAANGLFAFDVFGDLICLPTETFLGTADGIVRTLGGTFWLQRYVIPESRDGTAPIVQFAGTSTDNFRAANVSNSGRPMAIYQFDNNRGWQRIEPSDANVDSWQRLRATRSDDRDGWRVLDIAAYARATNRSIRGGNLSITWRSQPVWLGDREGSIVFQHDLVSSVVVGDKVLWMATAGGCVNYPLDNSEAGAVDLTQPEIHSRDLLPAGLDPWAAVAPPRVDIVRADAHHRVYAYVVDRNGAMDVFGPINKGGRFEQKLGKESPDYSAATDCLSALDNGFWLWKKTDARKLTIAFHRGRADLPGNYELLGNGTFRFFDATPRPFPQPLSGNRHHRTMVRCGSDIFLVTAGGILSFDAGTLQIDKLYAVAGDRPLDDIRDLYYDVRSKCLYAKSGDGSNFVLSMDSSSERFAAYSGTRDPFDDANIVVDNHLFRWRQLEKGAQVTVASSDLLPDQFYRCFHNGKFSFDYINAVALLPDRVVLATAGGVVEMDRQTHTITHVYARHIPADAANHDLRNVDEIVVDRQGDGSVQARTSQGLCLQQLDGAWHQKSPVEVEPVYRREYTRVDRPLWSWAQSPRGLHVQFHQSFPSDTVIGAAADACITDLMSRNRLCWDDVREAVLTSDANLFLATRAGVVSYSIDDTGQKIVLQNLYCGATSTGSDNTVTMADMQRIVKQADGSLRAWNDKTVFRGVMKAGKWTWTVDSGVTVRQAKTTWEIPDDTAGKWRLQTSDDGNRLKVTFISRSGTEGPSMNLSLAQTVPDVSRAVMAKGEIFVPTEQVDAKTGKVVKRDLLWVDRSLFRLQTSPWRWTSLVAVALVASFFAVMFVIPRLSKSLSQRS